MRFALGEGQMKETAYILAEIQGGVSKLPLTEMCITSRNLAMVGMEFSIITTWILCFQNKL